MSRELWCPYVGNLTVYVTIIQESTNYVYDYVNAGYVTENIDNWANYAYPLEKTTEDMWSVDMPASPNGWYKFLYRVSDTEGTAGAYMPTISDIILRSERLFWSGRILIPSSPEGVTPPTLTPYALCTLNQAKRYLNLSYTGTAYADYLLIDILNFVHSKIEKAADRKLYLRDYREKVKFEPGDELVYLSNWPIHYIKRVGMGRERGLTITHSGDDLRCTVGSRYTDGPSNSQVGDGALIIQIIDINGEETVHTLDFYTYKTLNSLATHINDTISNVTATVVTNAPSIDLWDWSNVDTTNVSTTLEIIQTSTVPYQLIGNYGGVKLRYRLGYAGLSNICDYALVEYRGGYDENTSEYDFMKHLVLDCTRLIYSKIGKDAMLKSRQIDTGEGLNVESYFSDTDIDKTISAKIQSMKEFALAE